MLSLADFIVCFLIQILVNSTHLHAILVFVAAAVPPLHAHTYQLLKVLYMCYFYFQLSGQSNLSVTTNRPVPPSLRHSSYGGMMDGNVPFPRTCGARFCGVGKSQILFNGEEHDLLIQMVFRDSGISMCFHYLTSLLREH